MLHHAQVGDPADVEGACPECPEEDRDRIEGEGIHRYPELCRVADDRSQVLLKFSLHPRDAEIPTLAPTPLLSDETRPQVLHGSAVGEKAGVPDQGARNEEGECFEEREG